MTSQLICKICVSHSIKMVNTILDLNSFDLSEYQTEENNQKFYHKLLTVQFHNTIQSTPIPKLCTNQFLVIMTLVKQV